MEAVVRKADNKIVHINGCGHGSIQSARYDYYVIPDQPIPAKWWNEEDRLIADLVWPNDLTRDLALEKAVIDRDTGRAINEAAHPFAGIEEQISILRAQIGEILNAIGLAPTAGFDSLNDIATEKIQEGQKKKEAL